MPQNLRSLSLCLCLMAPAAFANNQDIEKVNGAIVAEAGKQYGDLETVNGSITLEAGSSAEDVDLVNGGIRIADHVRAKNLSTVNGSIHTGPHMQLANSAETVNGGVFFDRGSRVGENIETVNGAIGIVETEVGGHIETINGDVTVGVGSRLRGHLKIERPNSNWMPINFNTRKPRIVIGPKAVVDGPLIFEREVVLYVHKTARIGKVTGATAVAYEGARAPQE